MASRNYGCLGHCDDLYRHRGKLSRPSCWPDLSWCCRIGAISWSDLLFVRMVWPGGSWIRKFVGYIICSSIDSCLLFKEVRSFLQRRWSCWCFFWPFGICDLKDGWCWWLRGMAVDVSGLHTVSSILLKPCRFILEGLFTVVVGAISFFIMSPFPEKAKFLNDAERSWVVHRVKHRGSTEHSQIAETDHFKWKYVWAAFLDWQIWLAIITDMAASCTIYGMSAFLPSIVAELGYSGNDANLLTIPPYVCACLLTIFLTWLSDRWRVRSTFVICLLVGEFVGYSFALAGSSTGTHGLTYAGVFISVSCCYPCFILIIVSQPILHKSEDNGNNNTADMDHVQLSAVLQTSRRSCCLGRHWQYVRSYGFVSQI